ncbi:NmrA family NAD(P)-binding protein [Kitasatospora acidiphila]|uniref:NmrA family NAD(P)-binding protein n=1 Tax=Kitasatospora acidiphila TaxID=2567942 RepID=UPI003C769F7E
MSDKKPVVLVTGATGGQGGAGARQLLDTSWAVRAPVRDPDSPRARELGALGAELVTGNLDDPGSLRAAAQGAHGVFSVQPAVVADPDPDREVQQGLGVADAALAATAHPGGLVASDLGSGAVALAVRVAKLPAPGRFALL